MGGRPGRWRRGRMAADKAQTELAGPQSSQGGKFGDWEPTGAFLGAFFPGTQAPWHTPRHFWALGTRWAEEIERHGGGGVAPAGGDTRVRPVPQKTGF